jgi:activating signal cointegrator complex subunit 2
VFAAAVSSPCLSSSPHQPHPTPQHSVAREAGPGVPPPAQQGALLYDNWILDVPKLMDLAALYGPTNPALVSRLLQQLLALQPRYWADIATAAAPLAGNLRELRASCGGMAERALLGGDAKLLAELSGA